jgi:hypothetical protein
MDLPPLIPVHQRLVDKHITDVPGEVRRQFGVAGLAQRVRPGSRIAVTAGSRGIANIATIVGAVVKELRSVGALPFVVPAMGSHGGATADGQRAVLAEYGITEESMGCPILSDISPVAMGHTPSGAAVFMDRNAHDADGVIVVGRVKPHTSFRAPVESGLCKMMAVGLGKQPGAESMHQHGLAGVVEEAGRVILATGKIVLGLAIIENAYEQTYLLEAVPPERIPECDRELLKLAASLLPRIPFDPLDLLVVDWMGKNLSGSGMDYNVIGLWRRVEGVERRPSFKYIAVLNLSPESGGNAIGVGAADFTTRRLFNQIDFQKTYMNALTANAPGTVKIPVILENDREAMLVALKTANPQGAPRLVRIHSTLHLADFHISPALLDEARSYPDLEIAGPAQDMCFDAAGNLN